MIQSAILCVIGSLCAITIRKATPEMALLVVLGTTAVVLIPVASVLKVVIETLQAFVRHSGAAEELFIPLYKTIGIALVVQVGGGLCKDAGGNALAAAVEIAGTICALVTALPLLQTVLSMLLEWV